jgi:hypothetical protein
MIMKRLHIIILAILGSFFLFSCEEEPREPVLGTDFKAPVINAPDSGSSMIMKKDMAEDTLTTFEWDAADFGAKTAISYTLEIDTISDFSSAIDVANTTEQSLKVLVSDINTKLTTQFEIEDTTQTSEIYFRIRASVNEYVDTVYSNTVNLNIQPYLVEIDYPEIYVPGGHQGWDPSTAPALTSANFDDKYEGYVYFPDAGTNFKFTDEGNWDTNWGDTGADGTLDPGGDNIVADQSGYYKINVDLEAMTYEMLNTQWAIIGDFNDWDAENDHDMTYQEDDGVWTTTLDLTAGGLKFRANDAWALNYGDDEADGTLETGGANIAVEEAGNYTVTLDLSGYPYTYSLTKN